VTHTYIKSAWQSLLRSSSEASAAGWLRSNAVTGEVGYHWRKEKRMQPQAEKPIWWRIVVGSLLVITLKSKTTSLRHLIC
jgi:hypothetical protein